MELHDFGEVFEKVREAVVAGVGVIFVLHAFFLKFFVEGGSSFFEAVVVVLALQLK